MMSLITLKSHKSYKCIRGLTLSHTHKHTPLQPGDEADGGYIHLLLFFLIFFFTLLSHTQKKSVLFSGNYA